MSLTNRFTTPDTRCLEKREISSVSEFDKIPTVSEFDEIRRGSLILRDDSNDEVHFIIRYQEKFWVLTEITILPFFKKFEFSRVLQRELSFDLVCLGFQRSYDISEIALVTWPSGARPDLSPEDEEVKRKLVKCAPRAYSELIRSDIPGPSGVRPTRLPFLRSSPLSFMKPLVSRSSSPSVLEPLIAKLIAKPTRR